MRSYWCSSCDVRSPWFRWFHCLCLAGLPPEFCLAAFKHIKTKWEYYFGTTTRAAEHDLGMRMPRVGGQYLNSTRIPPTRPCHLCACVLQSAMLQISSSLKFYGISCVRLYAPMLDCRFATSPVNVLERVAFNSLVISTLWYAFMRG